MPMLPPNAQQIMVNTDNAHERALARIDQLENELQQKDRALNQNLQEQAVLRQSLAACTRIIQKTSWQLNGTESRLKKKLKQVRDHIEALEQENKALNLTHDAWSTRSIKLEFDVLAAQESIKAITAAHDLAVSVIAVLERELQTVKAENDELKKVRDKEGCR